MLPALALGPGGVNLIALLAATLWFAPPAPSDEAREALAEGRWRDALALLETAEAPDYDTLLRQALAHGRLEEYDAARSALDRAIALDPVRPEAWTERGGLAFLQGRNSEAIRDLEQALSRVDDGYARDLLASALYLDGRILESLAEWNRLGKPLVGQVAILGLEHTRDRVARREIAVREGEMLERGRFEASRRRLAEVGVFERVTLRPVPKGDGRADLEVALLEQHGLARGLAAFAVDAVVNAAWKRVRLRYANVGGRGISVGAGYRWEENRPEATAFVQWPRPFAWPVYARVETARGRQAYEIEGHPFSIRRRGVDLGLRSVAGGRATVAFGLRWRRRDVSAARADAPSGTLMTTDLGADLRVADRHRLRLDLMARAGGTPLVTAPRFGRAWIEASARVWPSPPDQRPIEPSVLAARVRAAWGSAGMPLDERAALGTSPDMELPLRAHPQSVEGVLGGAPILRTFVLSNVEWRRRLLRRDTWSVGAVVFADSAWSAFGSGGSGTRMHDLGIGVRVALLGGLLVRADVAHGLTDGKNAISIGLNQAF